MIRSAGLAYPLILSASSYVLSFLSLLLSICLSGKRLGKYIAV